MSSQIETYARLKGLAEGQAGYFTAGQAASLGYASSQQVFHSRKGNWHKVCRNLYRLPGYGDSPESEFIKFSLMSIGRLDSPKAVLSHESALYYYGLISKSPEETAFTVPHDFRTNVPGSYKIYRKILDDNEIVNAGAFKVTSIPRTLYDVSRTSSMTKEELEKIAVNAFEKNLVNPKDLEAYGVVSKAVMNAKFKMNSSSAIQQASVRENKFAVLAIRSEGHLNEDLNRHLVTNLQRKGIIPIAVNFAENMEIMERELEEVMSLNPASIIIDGAVGDNIMNYLEARASSFDSAIFIITKPVHISGKFKSHSIVSDYWYGAYLATKHLIGLGHKRIMLMTHAWMYSLEHFSRSIECKFEDGYRMALKEAGLQDFEQYFHDENDIEADRAEFLKILKSKKRPTAILSFGDYRLTTKLECFRGAGVSIPEDISLIGYYNTPWSTVTDIQLTSVSIKEEEIALKIAEIISGEDKSNEILVKPELVLRKSCAARNQ